ncbi:hypothetical protein P153DRAFT_61422 [Dothidotthia symphoricarpi CBS 119687]|uniref:Uncharacterized protein n=1 Tax=Dothidotthia symphoricarpi CBS 119687 TaxID=1392245 RepID=A0A6A6A7I8_9PLEO|nr:uncharacterized protein P153DRAFT_61422 [Dothidotthia symphoricarpi CBS 119687]KAF2127205.1 hypothetical protein P153DRAFT_61422 [Dothidotthia symphoricarpi CBS 119687]
MGAACLQVFGQMSNITMYRGASQLAILTLATHVLLSFVVTIVSSDLSLAIESPRYVYLQKKSKTYGSQLHLSSHIMIPTSSPSRSFLYSTIHRRRVNSLVTKVKSKKPSNLGPLLQDIRTKLGSNWTFYQECLDSIVGAAAREQDTIAWLEQMQQVVEGREDLVCSHEGVLFLLSEMGIALPRQQGFVGVEAIAQATSSQPQDGYTLSSASLVDIMAPSPLSRALSTPPPSFTTVKIRTQPQNLPERMRITPFDFNPPTPPPSATFSPRNTANFAFQGAAPFTACTPIRLASNVDPIFFTDPDFQRDIQKFFGVASRSNGKPQVMRKPVRHQDETELVPHYSANEDDLNVWMRRFEASSKVKATIDQGRAVVRTDGREELDGLRHDLRRDKTERY